MSAVNVGIVQGSKE